MAAPDRGANIGTPVLFELCEREGLVGARQAAIADALIIAGVIVRRIGKSCPRDHLMIALHVSAAGAHGRQKNHYAQSVGGGFGFL